MSDSSRLGNTRADKVGFHDKPATVQRTGAAQTPLTDSTGGDVTAVTLAACTDTTATDQSATINNNFARQAVLLNEIIAALVQKGLIAGG